VTATAAPGFVGQRVRRKEDARLVRGAGRFVADITVPGALHAAILRSPFAYAGITRLDVSPALAVPGVEAAFSGADLAGRVGAFIEGARREILEQIRELGTSNIIVNAKKPPAEQNAKKAEGNYLLTYGLTFHDLRQIRITVPSVTAALRAWRGGDARAQDELMQLVYPELHRRAERLLARERPGHTLQPTALISELYLRLVDQRQAQWQDRAHFFAIASQLMRRVLVDEARKRRNLKRGGEYIRVDVDEVELSNEPRDLDLLALDQALDSLSEFAPRKSKVVELRFFGGLNIEETALVLGISTDIVKREWRTAKLWLLEELSKSISGV